MKNLFSLLLMPLYVLVASVACAAGNVAIVSDVQLTVKIGPNEWQLEPDPTFGYLYVYPYDNGETILAPVRAGYRFAAWRTMQKDDPEEDGSGSLPSLCTKDLTTDLEIDSSCIDGAAETKYWGRGERVVSPKYEKVWKISALATPQESGAQVTIEARSGDDQKFNVDGLVASGKTITLVAPQLSSGWSFDSWSDGDKTNPRRVTVTGEATYTAVYTANCRIELDSQGADRPGQTSVSVAYGDPLPKLSSLPEKTGNTFQGYFSKPNGAGDQMWWKNGLGLIDSWSQLSTATSYAHWAVHSYTVAYEGLTDDSSYVKAADYGAELALPEPSETGYAFTGWSVPSGLGSSTAQWRQSEGSWRSLTTSYSLCKADSDNPNRTVWMRNLTPTDKGAVTIRANWQANEYKVTFDEQGADGHGTGQLTVTFGQDPGPIQNPSKTGHDFGGYWTEPNGKGTQMWTAGNAWALQGGWPIPSNTTVYAYWSEKATRIVNFETVKSGNQSVTCTKGYPFGPYFQQVGIANTNEWDILLGWYTNDICRVLETDLVPYGNGELLLTAHWDKANYCLAFDANGGTGVMDVVEFKYDMPTNLPATAFGRTGYTFVGWTNRVNAVTNDSGQAVTNLLAQTPNGTNTLFSVWKANEYVLAFDANGGTVQPGKQPLEPMTLTYDQPAQLPANTYERGELWTFGGWSNGWNGTVYGDAALVTNAYDVAGGTNVLTAVWNSTLTDLSKAMHCTNLLWSSKVEDEWLAIVEATAGHEASGSCARREHNDFLGYLTAQITTNGVLRFWWKSSSGGALDVRLSSRSPAPKSYEATGGAWQQAEYVVSNVVSEVVEIRIANDADLRVDIDQMTWTPGAKEHPVPGPDDAVAISSLTVSGGFLGLSFAGNHAFDYSLLTNASLTVTDGWAPMETKAGAAEMSFGPLAVEGIPQLFFKVETLQKRD